MSENQTKEPIEAVSAMGILIEPEHATTDTPMNEAESPPLTHGLEALLGGLDPMMAEDVVSASASNLPLADTKMEEVQEEVIAADKFEEAKKGEVENKGAMAEETDANMGEVRSEDKAGEVKLEEVENPEAGMQNGNSKSDIPQDTAPSRITIPGLNMHTQASSDTSIKIENAELLLAPDSAVPEDQEVEGDNPEWEVDSSPIESSSDDSSDDSSDSDESDDGDKNLLLSVEEQARILMEGDGGSDDEGGKAKGSGGPLRTTNEVPDVVIPKPDVTITMEMPIKPLGSVETVVDNILLIKANTSGEYKVLESGSVLCLEDRSVFGVVAETIGRVQQPFYSVMFTNAAELQAANVPVGTKVFYTDKYATFVFTQALKAYKGSDASNIHDEEVGDEEVEFSDDEAEAEHKKKLKQKKLERRGGKAQQNGGPRRGGHPLQQSHQPRDASQGMNYDDVEDDGPYKPLARPTGYADSVGRTEAPQEGYPTGERPRSSRGEFRGRGRGGDRGRGDRGRGRGDRGRGRGGFQERGNDGYSLPPKPPQSFPQPPTASSPVSPFPQMPGFPNFFMPPNTQQNIPQYSPHQPQMAWPQFQQAFQNMQNMQTWPAAPPPMPPAQNGAFVNPAFFPNGQAGTPSPQWYQQNQQNNQNQNGQGRGRGQ